MKYTIYRKDSFTVKLLYGMFCRAISNLDFYLLRFDVYGKDFPKSQNMSPDCLIQLALQLTYYR